MFQTKLEAWLKAMLLVIIPSALERFIQRPYFGHWLTTFLDSYLQSRFLIPEEGDPCAPLVTFLVKDHDSEFSFEGANVTMNMTTTDAIDFVLKAKNRKGGPADPASITGSYTFNFPTTSASMAVDPTNPLKATVTGDPNSSPGVEDVGTLVFDGERTASDGAILPVHGEAAINVTLPGVNTVELEGTLRAQE